MEARKDAVETLISILEEQEKIYEELLELARQKQKILIKGDIAALAEITVQEEGLVLQAGKLEEKREHCFTALAQDYGVGPESTLADFLPCVDEPSRSLLERVHGNLSACLKDLQKFNQENTQLLEQSIQFVNFTVDVLSQQSKPLYNADKEVKVESLTNFLDKKV